MRRIRDIEGAEGGDADSEGLPPSRRQPFDLYKWKAKYGGLEVSKATRNCLARKMRPVSVRIGDVRRMFNPRQNQIYPPLPTGTKLSK